MRKNPTFFYPKLLFVLLLLPWVNANATTVMQMNLGQLTNNADKIFRGEVIAVKSDAVNVGGGKLNTTTYTIRVSDLIKGELASEKGKRSNLVQVQMVGSLKRPAAKDGIRYVGGFNTPNLTVGTEYLLFTTRPSAIGLSMTVGVGQGLFSFKDGTFVRNQHDNQGLFRGMSTSFVEPFSGALDYDDFVKEIESLLQR
ncbi:hypothetical protein GCM10008090_00360 [Arenicella chitinivorans]|uniref:Uncharacterized protein n=1 Tax=Arenicella chitinivorans TaxID=1329800 RepID=A0A918VG27_9GAMM|nr:hypothetical protein [Arenicella chitinivorans]GGZ96098.1 hypothetical protein GCM10008090_00360 [Arenicella chitinivorans]